MLVIAQKQRAALAQFFDGRHLGFFIGIATFQSVPIRRHLVVRDAARRCVGGRVDMEEGRRSGVSEDVKF